MVTHELLEALARIRDATAWAKTRGKNHPIDDICTIVTELIIERDKLTAMVADDIAKFDEASLRIADLTHELSLAKMDAANKTDPSLGRGSPTFQELEAAEAAQREATAEEMYFSEPPENGRDDG